MTNQLTAAEVREWRTETGMSQPDFGEMLDVSRSTIARWEEDGGDRPLWLGLARDGWRARHRPSSALEKAVREIAEAVMPKYLFVPSYDSDYLADLEKKGYVIHDVIGKHNIMLRDEVRTYTPIEAESDVIEIENTKPGRRFYESKGYIVESTGGNRARMIRTKL